MAVHRRSGTAGAAVDPAKTAGGPYPGTYYVFQGDAQIGSNGNSSERQITVLAEAKAGGVANAATCNKLGGNIDWKLFTLSPSSPACCSSPTRT